MSAIDDIEMDGLIPDDCHRRQLQEISQQIQKTTAVKLANPVQNPGEIKIGELALCILSRGRISAQIKLVLYYQKQSSI